MFGGLPPQFGGGLPPGLPLPHLLSFIILPPPPHDGRPLSFHDGRSSPPHDGPGLFQEPQVLQTLIVGLGVVGFVLDCHLKGEFIGVVGGEVLGGGVFGGEVVGGDVVGGGVVGFLPVGFKDTDGF